MDISKALSQYFFEAVIVNETLSKDTNITKETRKDSYDTVVETLGERQKMVYEYLANCENGATAKEISINLYREKKVASPERNSVHPRLNELVSLGLVEVVGKKTCIYTERKVAIYKNKI